MEHKNFGKYVAESLIECGLATNRGQLGCTDTDIETLKAAQHVEFLPPIYIDFLAVMGRGTDSPMFQGEDYKYNSLLRLKSNLNSLIVELNREVETPYILPSAVFVFLGHHGIAYWFFETSNHNPDPPVYLFDENSDGFVKQVYARLSELFREVLESTISDAHKELEQFRRALKNNSWNNQ